MKRNRYPSVQKRPVEGVLVIDKPTGISSYDVIRAVKRRLSAKKIGHTGTLDPLASGVLPLVINRATKVVPFLDETVKQYEGTLRLGIITDSDDSTGRVLRQIPLDWSALQEKRIRAVFNRFVGTVKQVPPMYSAAKCRGKRLYELARRGIEVERGEREVEIHSLEIVRIDLPVIDFRVSCSKGTYVRALVRKIGDALGVGAHLCCLRRVSSGPFSLREAVTLEELDTLIDSGDVEKRIITLREALGNLPEIEVDGELESRIKDGRQVFPRDLEGLQVPCLENNQWVKIIHRGEIVAIAKAQEGMRVPRNQSGEIPALSLLRVFA